MHNPESYLSTNLFVTKKYIVINANLEFIRFNESTLIYAYGHVHLIFELRK